MRNKWMVSAVMAAALAAGMAVPVMAGGGVVNVDVGTIKPVLRVQVPTAMAAEVDQFETSQTGTQIAAGEFDMENLSQVDVRVDVTSTVTLGSGITLESKKAAAVNSPASAAWLAVAAKSADKAYDDTATAGVTETKASLSETNTNVTTFGGAGNKAEQTFYLAKGTGSVSYKLAVPVGNKASVAYAQFYKLTELSLQPADNATLQAAVDAGDVYAAATGNIHTDGAAVEKLAKGTKNVTYNGNNTYFRAAREPSSSVASGNLYVYGSLASVNVNGGKAGFTYIGRLSDSKADWTKDDIKKFNISYTITGINPSKYDEVKNLCSYGYYRRFQDMTSALAISADGVIRMLIPPSEFDSLYLNVNGMSAHFTDTSKGKWVVGETYLEHHMSDQWKNMVKGKTLTVTLILKDGTRYVSTQNFPGQ